MHIYHESTTVTVNQGTWPSSSIASIYLSADCIRRSRCVIRINQLLHNYGSLVNVANISLSLIAVLGTKCRIIRIIRRYFGCYNRKNSILVEAGLPIQAGEILPVQNRKLSWRTNCYSCPVSKHKFLFHGTEWLPRTLFNWIMMNIADDLLIRPHPSICHIHSFFINTLYMDIFTPHPNFICSPMSPE